MTWKTLSKKTLIKNKLFSLTEEKLLKHNGKIAQKYFTVHRTNSVIIVPFTKEKEIVLIKQYRHPVRSTKYEVPAGYMEPNEKNPLTAARRELLEETGYKAKKFIKLGEAYASAGFLDNTVFFYLALNCEKISSQHLDQNEEIDVQVVSQKRAEFLLNHNEIKDMGSILGLVLAKEHLKATKPNKKK